MSATIAKAEALESVLLQGDLSKLTPSERTTYYMRVCESLSLNPLTKPFEYIELNRKLVLYAKRDCTEQLRKRDGVTITITDRSIIEGVYVVTAKATLPDGRSDESTGAVSIEGLKGEARANALMKGESKAKRRVTLSICGLGMLDESEVADVPAAHVSQPAPAALPAKPEAEKDTATFDGLRCLLQRAASEAATRIAWESVLGAWDELTGEQQRQLATLKDTKKAHFAGSARNPEPEPPKAGKAIIEAIANLAAGEGLIWDLAFMTYGPAAGFDVENMPTPRLEDLSAAEASIIHREMLAAKEARLKRAAERQAAGV